MDGINLQAALNNLTQMDRLQQGAVRNPIVNQEINSAIARETSAQRVDMPVQPDQVEGKVIDPNDKKGEKQQQKKRKKAETPPANDQPKTPRSGDGGFLVDLTA